VTIWQAKYFIRGVADAQKRQIRKSFDSALAAAATNGYAVARWVLCIPSSMDAPTLQWWHDWKTAQERQYRLRIDLWDETELRRLLAKPAAADLRRIYYHPYRTDDPDTDDPPRPTATPAAPAMAGPEAPWRGGDERHLGGAAYLLHDPVTERAGADRSWIWREATADRVAPDYRRVRLRQVLLRKGTPAAVAWRDGLRAQGQLMSGLKQQSAALPLLAECVDHPDAGVTLVIDQPSGLTWRQAFGPGEPSTPCDGLTAAAVVAAAADVCAALHELHRRSESHRALSPDGILLVDGARRPVLRDLGCARLPADPEEGAAGYRAPEQIRGPCRADARTDIYQLAAVVYHTLTGHPPTPMSTPPVRASLPDFPDALDDRLLRALDPDPERRPPTVRAVGEALRGARRHLSHGGLR
jgi:hypothetical protein